MMKNCKLVTHNNNMHADKIDRKFGSGFMEQKFQTKYSKLYVFSIIYTMLQITSHRVVAAF